MEDIRVRVTEDYTRNGSCGPHPGDEGAVRALSPSSELIGIEFGYDIVYGQDLSTRFGAHCPLGRGYWMPREKLEVLN